MSDNGRHSHQQDGEPAMKRSIGAKTLVYPTPTWIVGSYDVQGKSNGNRSSWMSRGGCNERHPQ